MGNSCCSSSFFPPQVGHAPAIEHPPDSPHPSSSPQTLCLLLLQAAQELPACQVCGRRVSLRHLSEAQLAAWVEGQLADGIECQPCHAAKLEEAKRNLERRAWRMVSRAGAAPPKRSPPRRPAARCPLPATVINPLLQAARSAPAFSVCGWL